MCMYLMQCSYILYILKDLFINEYSHKLFSKCKRNGLTYWTIQVGNQSIR